METEPVAVLRSTESIRQIPLVLAKCYRCDSEAKPAWNVYLFTLLVWVHSQTLWLRKVSWFRQTRRMLHCGCSSCALVWTACESDAELIERRGTADVWITYFQIWALNWGRPRLAASPRGITRGSTFLNFKWSACSMRKCQAEHFRTNTPSSSSSSVGEEGSSNYSTQRRPLSMVQCLEIISRARQIFFVYNWVFLSNIYDTWF